MKLPSHARNERSAARPYAASAVQHSAPTAMRPLGMARLPRRRFTPPTAVRVAQFCLVTRIALVACVLLTVGLSTTAAEVNLLGFGRVTLPGSATWSALAVWVFAGAVFETVLVLRLGHLRTGSRRVILLVESLVITMSGLYAAAGLEIALVPLVGAIAAVVLLRLDHVRHSFDCASAQRRLLGRTVQAVLYDGYAPGDPTGVKHVQVIGYRVGVDCERLDAAGREMSRA